MRTRKTLHFIPGVHPPTNPLKSANKKKILIQLSVYPCVDKSNANNLDPCVVDKPRCKDVWHRRGIRGSIKPENL